MDHALLDLAERPTREHAPHPGSDRLRFHVEGLDTWYGPKQALIDISLDIYYTTNSDENRIWASRRFGNLPEVSRIAFQQREVPFCRLEADFAHLQESISI